MHADFMIYSKTASWGWFTIGPSLEGVRAEHAKAVNSGKFPRPLYRIVVKRNATEPQPERAY